METFAKNGENIDKTFNELVEQLYKTIFSISIQHNEEEMKKIMEMELIYKIKKRMLSIMIIIMLKIIYYIKNL